MRVGVRGKRKVFGLGSLGKKGFLEEMSVRHAGTWFKRDSQESGD